MTLQEFRKNQKLVKAASRLANEGIFKAMMRVLWEEHPMFNHISRIVGIAPHDPSYQLGTVDGANRIMGLLQQMGKPLLDGTELKPTYEPPEEQ